MKRKLLLLLVFLGIGAQMTLMAQDATTDAAADTAADADTTVKPKYWSYKGTTALNVNQIALVNWAAGGQSSVGINALVDFATKYEKNKFSWEFQSKMTYGVQKSGKQNFRKSDDLLDITSAFNYKIAKGFKVGFIQNFRSQFAPGYEYPDNDDDTKQLVSRFMSPAYVTIALGIEYDAPKYFKLFLSPVTSKTYVVMDTVLIDQTKYGIDDDKRVFQNFGAYMKANFEAEVFKNVTLATQLELFSNYLKEPQNVDVIWGTKISMKVNSWLSVILVTDLIYDHDIDVPKENAAGELYYGKGTQFRENLSVGINYKFASKEPGK